MSMVSAHVSFTYILARELILILQKVAEIQGLPPVFEP